MVSNRQFQFADYFYTEQITQLANWLLNSGNQGFFYPFELHFDDSWMFKYRTYKQNILWNQFNQMISKHLSLIKRFTAVIRRHLSTRVFNSSFRQKLHHFDKRFILYRLFLCLDFWIWSKQQIPNCFFCNTHKNTFWVSIFSWTNFISWLHYFIGKVTKAGGYFSAETICFRFYYLSHGTENLHQLINTQYTRNSTILYPLKMEYGWNFSFFA